MRRAAPLLVAAVLLAVLSMPTPAAATGPPTWAPLATATIYPGVQTFTAGGQCTANFVFWKSLSGGGHDVFLGQAAHCASQGGSTSTNGCTTPSLNVGTKVTIQGAQYPGTLAYSSWKTMQSVKETNGLTCAYNDFALVRLDPRDHVRVNPSVRHYGGPTASAPLSAAPGPDKVLSFQNSGLRPGPEPVDRKEGYVTATSGGWVSNVYFLTPGVPGDSGSPVILPDGRGLGVLIQLWLLPNPGSNAIVGLESALAYANNPSKGNMGVTLGTAPLLTPGLLPNI